MDKSDFIRFITDNGKLDEDTLLELEKLMCEYPYFQSARLLLAKNRYAINREEFDKDLQKTAIFCADRSQLFYLINGDRYGQFFLQGKASDDPTQALLDSYLDGFLTEDQQPEGLENIVSVDYLAYLHRMEREMPLGTHEMEEKELKHHEIIDRFLEKAEAHEIAFPPFISEPEQTERTVEELQGDGFLTEILAKIYIKQKKYKQALEIIKQLSLNFPKKSVYFADQIRFLELLILNEKNKKQ